MEQLTLDPILEIHLKPDYEKNSKNSSLKDPAVKRPVPQIAVLDKNGVIQTVNESWTSFAAAHRASEWHNGCAGMNYPEICKKNIARFSEESSNAANGILAALNGSLPAFELEYACYTLAGKRWFLMSVISLPGNTGAIVTHTDITEQKIIEKMRDDFINIVSHELKTPITSLKGIVHILQLSFLKKMTGDGSRLLSTMDSQLDKLTRIIGDLLDIYTVPGQEMTLDTVPFDFTKLVVETVDNVRNMSPLHFISIKENEPVIYIGDRFRIEQVITNLLTNAVKYSPQSNQVLISSVRKNNTIVFSVQDFGIGISQEDLASVFQRFYRVDNGAEFNGLGLGLHISSEIIKAHRGKFWAESQVGQGSIFYFSLPLPPG